MAKRYAKTAQETGKPCCPCLDKANEAVWNASEKEPKKFKYKYGKKERIKPDDWEARTYWMNAYEKCIEECPSTAHPSCTVKDKCKGKLTKSDYVTEKHQTYAPGALREACGKEDEEKPVPATTGKLIVTVKDKNTGDPVKRATVKISGPENKTSLTDDEKGVAGVAEFDGIKPGQYNVEAHQSGYDTVKVGTGSGTVPPGGTDEVVIELVATGTLIITVKEKGSSRPYKGADVKAEGPVTRTGTTPATGRLRFERIPPGKYKVQASKSVYVQTTKSARVIVGEPSKVELTLPKAKLFPRMWFQETTVKQGLPAGRGRRVDVTGVIIIYEEYIWLPDDWVEYGTSAAWLEKYVDVYVPYNETHTFERCTAVYRSPDGLYYSEKIGKGALKAIEGIAKGSGVSTVHYKSWDHYRNTGGRIEKYRKKGLVIRKY